MISTFEYKWPPQGVVWPGFPIWEACELIFPSERGGLCTENFQIWGLVNCKFPNLGLGKILKIYPINVQTFSPPPPLEFETFVTPLFESLKLFNPLFWSFKTFLTLHKIFQPGCDKYPLSDSPGQLKILSGNQKFKVLCPNGQLKSRSRKLVWTEILSLFSTF